MADQNEEIRLLARIADGDRAAFRAVYDLHVRRVYAVCLRLCGNYEDAEEAVQDTFLELLRIEDRARTIRNLAPWLLQVASRRATDLLRRRIRHEVPQQQIPADPEGARVLRLEFFHVTAPDAREAAERGEMLERLRALSQRLPERQLLAFTLRHFQGLSIYEIAAAMECSEGAVKAHLHLALRKMKDFAAAEGLLGNTEEKNKRKAGR